MSPAEESRSFDLHHDFREFAQGVAWVSESGNTTDVGLLIERLTEALWARAQEHANATVRPRLPAWITSIIVGLAVMSGSMFVTGLMRFATVEAEIAALQNAHPESITALATEVHTMNQRLAEIERRFNDVVDNAKRQQ